MTDEGNIMTTWINVKLLAPECKPERKTAGAVGYDLVARVAVTVPPGKVGKVLTGVCLELHPGEEAQVRPRSGLSLRGIIGVPGTVDSDYRGEVGCLLHNTTAEPFAVEAGDRVAQLVFSRVLLPTLTVCAELGSTDRGEGGFGSTGGKA
jgi:dUTP pyrophosphatase